MRKLLSNVSTADLIDELFSREDLEFDHVGLLADKIEALIYEDNEDLKETLATKVLDIDDVREMVGKSEFEVFKDDNEIIEYVKDNELMVELDRDYPFAFRKTLGELLDIPSASITNERILKEVAEYLP
jgi:uncharacterized protein (DUF779 family)